MTELEFYKKCEDNNIDIPPITNNYFVEIPNTIGCNKIDKEYIIYYIDEFGKKEELLKIKYKKYALEFLYSAVKLAKEWKNGEKVKRKMR